MESWLARKARLPWTAPQGCGTPAVTASPLASLHHHPSNSLLGNRPLQLEQVAPERL